MIDAGGDIVAGKIPPGMDGWKIAINLPETEEPMKRKLMIESKAVATSGDLYQYIELNGNRYSHIINPATGYAVTNLRNVTVITDDSASADGLATALSIFPKKQAIRSITKFSSSEVPLEILKNNHSYFYRSHSLPSFSN